TMVRACGPLRRPARPGTRCIPDHDVGPIRPGLRRVLVASSGPNYLEQDLTRRTEPSNVAFDAVARTSFLAGRHLPKPGEPTSQRRTPRIAELERSDFPQIGILGLLCLQVFPGGERIGSGVSSNDDGRG